MIWLEYLQLADEADKRANGARDGLLKNAWRRIAEGYRDLARREAGQSPSAMPSLRGSAAPT